VPTLLLIDGHSQAYRAFFAIKNPMSTRDGEPTGAVYGFARKLLSTLRDYKPEGVAVAFDTGDTWRHGEFPAYKATRDAMPDEMRTQMARIEQLLRAFDIPIITYPNFEADDILGTLARKAAAEGTDVLVMTGDRDMFQLVDERVKILYTSGGPNPETKIYGVPEVAERYGLTPEQFIDLKALTGDSSDNIPGVPGIGDKTATKFLQQYGSLAGLYAHIDEVGGPKTRQNLVDAHDLVLLNKRLVTIHTDLPIAYDSNACRFQGFSQEEVANFFNQLEFRSLTKELPALAGETAPSVPPLADTSPRGQMSLFGVETPRPAQTVDSTYGCVADAAALETLVAAVAAARVLSFDVETTSTDAMQAQLVGLGLAWDQGQAAYIPLAHADATPLAWGEVRQQLAAAFADPKVPKVAHNAKYDLTVLRRYGLDVAGTLDDTLIMAWLLDSASRSLGLKALAADLLGWQMTELTELIGTGRKQITMEQVPAAQAGAYCGADVDATIHLYAVLEPKLQAAELWQLYTEIERPLIPVLTDMEMAGVLLDLNFLKEMSSTLGRRVMELETELHGVVGHAFNIRSTQQMSQVLFEELKFPTRGLKKTASGHFSTAADVLDGLALLGNELSSEQRRAIDLILEHRQLEKLRGTYVDSLPALINPQTGRVHTSFSQTGSVTGRLSSSNPNLQNIPIRTEIGREIRAAIIAPPGCQLISADYSQVELRILADVANEELLVEAFLADQDIHAVTGARLFNVPLEEVTKSQRGLGKTINFATIYGVSAFGLSSRTELSPEQARQFLEQYFRTYPRIREYIEVTLNQAREQGYVATMLGRKRFFPEFKNPSLPFNQRQALERQAINAPIQGTAADIMKIAMIRVHRELRAGGYAARMLLQVHDELVIECPDQELDAVVALVRECMQSAYSLRVPLRVDVEVGPNWRDMQSV
jgi:DNA polymerase-1